MRNDHRQPHKKFTYVIIFMIAMTPSLQVYSAVIDRGEPGSDQRRNHCLAKKKKCNKEALKDCFNEGNGTLDVPCHESEEKACDIAYGGQSDCVTRDRWAVEERRPRNRTTDAPRAHKPDAIKKPWYRNDPRTKRFGTSAPVKKIESPANKRK